MFIQTCYPCFGLNPYNLWSIAEFSLFSSVLLSQEGNSRPIRSCSRENSRSKGRPQDPTRPITQAPLRVLRYTFGSGRHTVKSHSDFVTGKREEERVVYFLSNSTDFHGQVNSRVPNSDQQHSLPLQIVSAAVVPAVEELAFKTLNA